MRPFPYRQSRLDPRKKTYNIRLCKARRVVENAFGILVQKLRIFFRPIATKVENTILIVKTACVLHNFLRAKQCDNNPYCELMPPDQPSQQSAFTNMETDPKRATNLAFSTREKFVDFFIFQ
jgi:hypothetical protein